MDLAFSWENGSMAHNSRRLDACGSDGTGGRMAFPLTMTTKYLDLIASSMQNHLVILFLSGCLGLTVSSCASINALHPQRVNVLIPSADTLFHQTGMICRLIPKEDGRTLARLEYPQDNLLYIREDSNYYEVHPSKDLYPFVALDFLTLGIGSFIDDLTNSTVEYVALRFDSTDRAKLPKLVAIPSRVNVDEEAGLVGGFYPILEVDYGGIYSLSQNAIFPANGGAGLGIGYRRRLELFGKYEAVALMQIHSESANTDFNGTSFSKSLTLRAYPYSGFFASAGVQWIRAISGAQLIRSGSEAAQTLDEGRSDFQAFSFSIGYSGQWTFCEYERAYSMKQVLFGKHSLAYSFGILRFGINIRLR
jgi:hypothetical protein